ncbi:hypothetical protein J6590_043749 [Homalodisca vitripennis]|nr:hypothetical protein J6590_043749 [Homalodisca vitripennis]
MSKIRCDVIFKPEAFPRGWTPGHRDVARWYRVPPGKPHLVVGQGRPLTGEYSHACRHLGSYRVLSVFYLPFHLSSPKG